MPSAALDGDGPRKFEHVPDAFHPGTDADNEVVAGDRSAIGFHSFDGAAGAIDALEAVHPGPGQDAYSLALRLGRQPVQTVGVVGVAARLLMQHRGDSPGLPVVEHAPHVLVVSLFTLGEDRLVADLRLLLGDAGHVLAHALGTYLHVTHRMVGVGLCVALPHRDAVGHEFAHGRLKVVVAHHPTGNTGCARADGGLFNDEDVLTAAPAAAFQFQGQVVGGAETVDPGADDQVFAVGRKSHPRIPELDQNQASEDYSACHMNSAPRTPRVASLEPAGAHSAVAFLL